jgi:hypothetical protein
MDPLDPQPMTILVPPNADADALANALRNHADATVITVTPENAIDIDGILKRGMAGEERVVLLDPEAVTAALVGIVADRPEGWASPPVVVDAERPRGPTVAGVARLGSPAFLAALEGLARLPHPRVPPALAALETMAALAGGAMMPEDRRLFRRPERAPQPPREVQEAAAKKAADKRARKAERNLALVRSGGMAAR